MRARGVVLKDGQRVMVRREVILAAGAFKSPEVLELSGVGNSTILEAAGIKPVVDLPGVGEHLQDHLRIQNYYQLKPGLLSSDELRSNTTYRMEQIALYNASIPNLYWGSRNGYAFLNWNQIMGADTEHLAQLATEVNLMDNTRITGQKVQFLTDASLTADVPQVEIFLSDGYTGRLGYPTDNTSTAYDQGFFTLFASLQHLLSQGSVHIMSNNVSDPPQIDPRYLSNAYDFEAVLTAAKYLRMIARTSPLVSFWTSEYEPGESVQSEQDWEYYIRNSSFSVYHPVGTCAMLPLQDGGVVDPQLRVYGIERLRVVDASIIPLLPSGHIQTAVYGIAERAARMVVESWSDEAG